MNATTDYGQPYGTLAQQHKDGLDAIITSIGSGGSSTVTADDIIDAVVDYMETTFFGGSASPDAEVNFKAGIANAMNGYLQNGGSSPYLRTLQSIPATALANGFDRLADALPAARSLKGGADGAQMVQVLGQADAEYWANQIATTGSWTPYLNGNAAIDTANVPFWVDAAMFGAQFSYGQLPGTDLDSVGAIIIGVLSGSLATAAGKVVFGWVPKIESSGDPHENLNGRIARRIPRGAVINFPTNNPGRPNGKVYGYSCDNGATGTVEEFSLEHAQDTVHVIGSLMGTACALIPYTDK